MRLTQTFFCSWKSRYCRVQWAYHAYRIEKPVIEDINISTQGELATFLPMHFTNPLNATGNYYVNVKYDVDLLNVH